MGGTGKRAIFYLALIDISKTVRDTSRVTTND